MTFERTLRGKIAKYRFFPEPVVWVEGRDDIACYSPVLRDLQCRVEVADGIDECKKLIKAIVEEGHQFIVIVDGHYDILQRKRSVHRWVILLYRHSIENYFYEKEPFRLMCTNSAKLGAHEDIVGNALDELAEHVQDRLWELVILDIATSLSNAPVQGLPNRAEPLLNNAAPGLELRRDQVERKCKLCWAQIDESNFRRAEQLLEEYLNDRRFVDILKGHFVFSLLRHLFLQVVNDQGRRPHLDNHSLRLLFAEQMWASMPSKDHESLKRRLRAAVREVAAIRAEMSS